MGPKVYNGHFIVAHQRHKSLTIGLNSAIRCHLGPRVATGGIGLQHFTDLENHFEVRIGFAIFPVGYGLPGHLRWGKQRFFAGYNKLQH